MGLKPLKPSLREKKRYLAFEVLGSKLPAESVSRAVKSAVLQFVGELGLAKMGLIVLNDCYKNNKGIAKCSHTSLDTLKASLAFVKDIDGHAVTVRSLTASGAVNKAKASLS
ncbi:hypothetical protein HY492_02875 [Candidatus Woesearchaeota archaeon]|nr:hypothetical protein [Candidatus Woesearchaeota archaeon]